MNMKNFLAIALGILSAIGGFVDIGDLVFNTQAGATFGFQLLWVVVVGVVGIIVYSEMCGRVAAVAKRPVFDLVRERAGFGAGLSTLIASQLVNLLTCAAEIGGVAICMQLLSGLPYRLLIPVAVVGLAVACWVLRFEWIERVFGYLGLGLLVFAVAAIKLHPGLEPRRARFRAGSPRGRQPAGLSLLRRRPARRGDDALRGLLLLLGRGRGRLGPEGARPEQGDLDDRLRARRLPLVRADDRRGCSSCRRNRPAVPRHAAAGGARHSARWASARARRDPVRGRRRCDRDQLLGAYNTAQFFGWRWGKKDGRPLPRASR